jgi:hypothetical protein
VAVVALVSFGLYQIGSYFYHYSDSGAPGSAPADNTSSGCLSTGITGGTITAMSRDQAGTTASIRYLRALRGSKIREVLYAGPYVSLGRLVAWLNEAECDGLMTDMLVNPAFSTLSTDKAKRDYIAKVNENMNLQAYWIDANSVPHNPTLDQGAPGSFAVRQWKDTIAQTGTSKPVRVLGEFFHSSDAGQNAAHAEAYEANPYVPLFLPVGASRGAGSSDEYADVGRFSFELSTLNAWGAVQAYGKGGARRPSAKQVGLFTRMLTSPERPVTKILLYSKGAAGADVKYIIACAEQVARVVDA